MSKPKISCVQLHRSVPQSTWSIGRIAYDGMADSAQMNSDLVRSSGFELERQECACAYAPQHFDVGDRGLSARLHGDLLTIPWVSAEGTFDRKAGLRRYARDNGDISSVGFFTLDLTR